MEDAGMQSTELSPRMWGWTGLLLGEPQDIESCPHACGGGPTDTMVIHDVGVVVPTHVGVDRRWSNAPPCKSGCPHACGGGPSSETLDVVWEQVVPTHVGVDRMRIVQTIPVGPLSPRMWGWTGYGVEFGGRDLRCPHACGGGPNEDRL